MKKNVLTMFMVCFVGASLHGQNFNEWFRQNKTQKEYLVQQIAALKVYLEYLREGFDIARRGLGIIGDIKDGNFKDHQDFFASLKAVNPVVRNSPKLVVVLFWQDKIVKELRKLNDVAATSQWLSHEEKDHITLVYRNMLALCEHHIDESNVIITDYIFQMSDDERIRRIDSIYDEMKDQYTFTRSLCNSVKLLISQRSREEHERARSEKLLTPGL